ncbi:unnamed protein product [Brassica oleracea]
MEEEADDDQLWSDEGMQTKLSSDVNRDEMYNPLYPASQHFTKETAEDLGLKRKAWLTSDNGNSTSFFKGETSGTSGAKRKKGYARWARNHLYHHEDSLLELSRPWHKLDGSTPKGDMSQVSLGHPVSSGNKEARRLCASSLGWKPTIMGWTTWNTFG